MDAVEQIYSEAQKMQAGLVKDSHFISINPFTYIIQFIKQNTVEHMLAHNHNILPFTDLLGFLFQLMFLSQ